MLNTTQHERTSATKNNATMAIRCIGMSDPSSEMAFEFGLSRLIAGLVRKVEDRYGIREPFQRGRDKSR